MNAAGWRATLAATALMGLGMGNRSAFGLFMSPLNSSTGLGLAKISLGAALGQLAMGFAQPLLASLAEKYGSVSVMACGAVVLAGSSVLLTQVDGMWTLMALMLLSSLGVCAMASNAMLMGEVGRRVPAHRQGLASGIVGAGGSAGQLVLAPLTQFAILLCGWRWAMCGVAVLMLLALPLLHAFSLPASGAARTGGSEPPDPTLGSALRDRRLWFVSAGFAACGFHVAFLSTHLPGVFESCGLPAAAVGISLAVLGAANMVGSVGIGLLMRRHRSAFLLALLYLTRAVAIASMLLMPPTTTVMLVFTAILGLTYIAPLAPTAQLLAQYFGTQRLGTLFGVVMVAHQIGGFAGAWLGGVAVAAAGSYQPLWLADIALALLGAALQWPLRERVTPAGVVATPPVAPSDRLACGARRALRRA